MVRTAQPTQTRAWAKAIFHTAQEFGPLPLSVLAGTIPVGLRGALYRNGPARLERTGQRVEHWFDGDGGILGVHFTETGATGLFRYVQTAGYRLEESTGRFLLGGYGMLPPGPLWERFGKDVKNTANTSVLALPDRLLALWEGGPPYALTLDRLDTIGLDDLGGSLKQGNYSAHCKRDPKTGEIFNFGIHPSLNSRLDVYRSDRTGKIQQQGQIGLQGIPVIHDFAFAGQYLIFCVSPVALKLLPAITYLKSYSDALVWQPGKGTEIIVVDRQTLAVVSRGRAEPWYQWHYANAYTDADGSVVLALVRFPDFQTNQNLKEIATGTITTPAKGTLWHLRLDPRSGTVLELEEVLSRGCEFPVVKPEEVGQPWRYTYLAVRRAAADADDRELFGAIARFDHQTRILTELDAGENRYPGEPIYAADAHQPERGWILTLVYDGESDRSELWICDADHLDAGPVCRLGMPQVIPFGFHGTWQPDRYGHFR